VGRQPRLGQAVGTIFVSHVGRERVLGRIQGHMSPLSGPQPAKRLTPSLSDSSRRERPRKRTALNSTLHPQSGNDVRTHR